MLMPEYKSFPNHIDILLVEELNSGLSLEANSGQSAQRRAREVHVSSYICVATPCSFLWGLLFALLCGHLICQSVGALL